MARTPPPPAFDESTGLLHVVAAVDAPDADDEVVVPSTLRLDHYRANPVVLFGHDQQRMPVAACDRVELVGDELHQWWRFGDTREARDVAKLYRAGILRGASVGFKSDGTRRISADEAYRRYGVRRPLKVHLGGDLKETSAVPVPCNPGALAVGWVGRPAALRVAADMSPLVRKALDGLTRQAHRYRTMPRTTRRRPVSATATETADTTTTKAMDTLGDAAGGSTVAMADDAPPPADTDHTVVICDNTLSAGQAIWADIVAGKIDPAAGLKKLKTLLKAHCDLVGDAAEDEAPEEEPADEEPDGDEMPEGDDGADDLETMSYHEYGDDEDDLEEKAVGDKSANQDGQRAAMYAKDPEMEEHMERHGVKPRKKKAVGGLTVKALGGLADAVADLQEWRDAIDADLAALKALQAKTVDALGTLAGAE